MSRVGEAITAYRIRWLRRRLLWRALRARHALTAVADRTFQIVPGTILAFLCVRDEAARLPHVLAHHRALGVGHFLIVDNGSSDGSAAIAAEAPDVSLWQTGASYRAARFGTDWLGWLRMRHGHGHWCLTIDADEFLVYPYWQTRPLSALCGWLDRQGTEAYPAMMLDLYPGGPLGAPRDGLAGSPLDLPCWFDAGNHVQTEQHRTGAVWVQGGARARQFHAEDPRSAPTLNKLPLVRWNRRYVYLDAAHTLLPRRLNRDAAARDGGEAPSGLLLHAKLLDRTSERIAVERARAQHFARPETMSDYYAALEAAPVLHRTASTRLRMSWRHLEALGLMSRGGWI